MIARISRDYARPQRPRGGPPRKRAVVRKPLKSSGGSAALGLPLWAWMIVSLSLMVAAAAIYYIARPVAPMDMAPSSGDKTGRALKAIEIPPKEPSRFAFYEMLPSYEVVVPDDVLNPPKPKPGASRNNLPAEAATLPADERVAASAAEAAPVAPTAAVREALPPDLQSPPAPAERNPAVAKPLSSKPALAAIAPAAPASPSSPAISRVPTAAAERELAAALAREAPQPTAQLQGSERFVIQVAAFRSRSDAEQRVAALTLAGLAARVEQVTIDDKDTWYRVRLGPYGNAGAAASAQQSLKAQGFSGVVMKVKR